MGKAKRKKAKEPDKKKIEESHNQWKDTHAKKPKKIAADSSKWDLDHEKIAKNKAEIKAIKEKKRASKLAKENDLKQRNSKRKSYGNSAHEKKPKKMAGVDRNGLDEDKVNKKRAEIKALKEKKRIEKALKAEADARGRSSSRSKKKKTPSKTKTKKKKEEEDANGTSWGGTDIHAKKPKKIKGVDRKGLDEDKVNAKRAEIKALKEKRRKEKELGIKAESKIKFGNQHESNSGSTLLKAKEKNAKKKTKKELELERKREETKAMQRRRASQNKLGIKQKSKIKFGNQHEQ